MTSTLTLNSAANRFLPLEPSSSDWQDVTPVYQQDSETPLCPILYDTKYSSSMDLLRSILSSNNPERSPRTLALTEHLIRLNPSNYSVWNFRAYILLGSIPLESSFNLRELSKSILFHNENEELKEELEQELDFIEDLANRNMKGYQVWQHRRLILTALGNPEKELEFTRKGLENDSKNYHTWVYRQWVLSYFGGISHYGDILTSGALDSSSAKDQDENQENLNQCPKLYPELWDEELNYVESLLKEDIRNNSAWNHRYFVLISTDRFNLDQITGKKLNKKESILKEIEYTKSKIQIAPNNPSPWNYLKGLLSNLNSSYSSIQEEEEEKFKIYSNLLEFSISLLPTSEKVLKDSKMDSNGNSSIGALEFCFDELEQRIKIRKDRNLDLASDLDSGKEKKIQGFKKEIRFWKERLFNADPIRKRYWNYRGKELEKLL